MKRILLVVLSVIILCSLSLPVALVNAYYEGYATTNYQAIEEPVADGKWTTDNEWTDAMIPPNLPENFHWRQKWTWPGNIIEHFLIEFFIDDTDDAGDYFQLCIDHQANGGDAPQADDLKIEWVGHEELTIYQGDGTGWVEFTDYTWETDIYIVDSIDSSPLDSNPHWIIELWMDRSAPYFDVSGAGYAPWIRLAVYDESTDTLAAWPPTSPDVPDDWGLETGTTESIPESLTFVTAALLSSVAIVVSCYLLRRRPKTEKN
ncbi:MAG TPA: hypothetical protein ENN36_01555 [Candidatus Bathyarchaeota archaeon]|nr:hypothetical protein [Candidatus Bathyarchaeota archaeon]